MQCQQCANADAVIQLTKVVDNQTKVLHLCEACAAEQGVETGPSAASLPLTDFLAQIGKGVGEGAGALGRCPSCGLTPAQLKQAGRLGCSTCYTHFEPHLRGLLRRLHGGTQHVGKVTAPRGAEAGGRRVQVDSLRRSLQRAIDAEDFEYAASLRDQIRQLESQE